jgi:hypothetical protein
VHSKLSKIGKATKLFLKSSRQTGILEKVKNLKTIIETNKYVKIGISPQFVLISWFFY